MLPAPYGWLYYGSISHTYRYGLTMARLGYGPVLLIRAVIVPLRPHLTLPLLDPVGNGAH